MTATAELRQAHKDGKIGVAFDPARISPSLLSRWRSENGGCAKGMYYKGYYLVMFPRYILDEIKGDK